MRAVFCNATGECQEGPRRSEWRTHRIYGTLTDWERTERAGRSEEGPRASRGECEPREGVDGEREANVAGRGEVEGEGRWCGRRWRKEKGEKGEVVAVRFVRGAGGNRWEPTVTNKSNTNVPTV